MAPLGPALRKDCRIFATKSVVTTDLIVSSVRKPTTITHSKTPYRYFLDRLLTCHSTQMSPTAKEQAQAIIQASLEHQRPGLTSTERREARRGAISIPSRKQPKSLHADDQAVPRRSPYHELNKTSMHTAPIAEVSLGIAVAERASYPFGTPLKLSQACQKIAFPSWEDRGSRIERLNARLKASVARELANRSTAGSSASHFARRASASTVTDSRPGDSWRTATASWLTTFEYDEELTPMTDAQRWGASPSCRHGHSKACSVCRRMESRLASSSLAPSTPFPSPKPQTKRVRFEVAMPRHHRSREEVREMLSR